jgi:hypothetical protein
MKPCPQSKARTQNECLRTKQSWKTRKQKDWKKLQKDSFIICILYLLLLELFTSGRVRFMRHAA